MKYLASFVLGIKCVLCIFIFASQPLVGYCAPEKQVITFWCSGLGFEIKGVEKVIGEFEKENPQYKVRLLSMGAGRRNPQKLMTSIVGKVPPDIVFQDRFAISDWASRGAFMPLDRLIVRDIKRNDPLVPQQHQYYNAAWQEVCYNGKVYGIPKEASSRILYWNREIFRKKANELIEAGLDPNRAPSTWSEMLRYSKVITELNPDGSLKLAGFFPNAGNCWLYMYCFQNNASLMSPDRHTCTLNTPEAQEALKFMVDGYSICGGYSNVRGDESYQGDENDPFLTGKVAMVIDLEGRMLTKIARYNPQMDFGVSPPPIPDDRYAKQGRFANEKDTFVTWIGGSAYCIPVGARNVEGAWKFIKFLTSTRMRLASYVALRDWAAEMGRFHPPRLEGSVEANRELYEKHRPSDPRLASALKQHIDILPCGRIRPVTFVGQTLWDEHVRAFEKAALYKASPAAALADGQKVVQQELDAFYSQSRYPVIHLKIPIVCSILSFIVLASWALYRYRKGHYGRLTKSEIKWAYVFVSPWLIGFFVFILWPMIASLFFSFTQYNVLSDARWVGMKNYIDLVQTDSVNIHKAVSNIIYLGVIGVPLSLVTGLAVALTLNAAAGGIRVYRTLFYLPAVMPKVAAAILWVWLLTPDPSRGLINSIWQVTIATWFDVSPPGWLHAEQWAKPSLILMGIWGAGSGMILWLAGLKNIPKNLYEAASIDGANTSQQFWNVTVPQLSPIILFNMVMGFITALQEFERIYIMKPTESTVGPADSLLVPVYYLFTNGFNYFKMGYASAIAWILFLVVLVLTLIQLKMASKWVHYEVEK